MNLKSPKLKRNADPERKLPGYLLGGHLRTSTVVLILVFAAAWWTYDSYRQEPQPVPAPQVVPPGFIPDPSYTWVPRTRLQQPPVTVTETPSPTTVTETVTSTPEAPPPFCPPFCPPPPPPPPEAPEPASPAPQPPHPPTATAPPVAPQPGPA